MKVENKEFELRGINHLALVCSDMARTVDFYTNVLGMPLVKTLDLPGGMGQHFFFDIGKGDMLAFFWFPDAPAVAPGIASPGEASLTTAHGSMNHVAFDVPAEKIEEYREKLVSKGIAVTEVTNHDDSERQVARKMHPGVWVRSIYFRDPDGILLEFASTTRELGPHEVKHQGATPKDRERYLRERTAAAAAVRR
jgi:catechol 2,3-dioxygenase-like lactoylglutathione lyase family enzyme